MHSGTNPRCPGHTHTHTRVYKLLRHPGHRPIHAWKCTHAQACTRVRSGIGNPGGSDTHTHSRRCMQKKYRHPGHTHMHTYVHREPRCVGHTHKTQAFVGDTHIQTEPRRPGHTHTIQVSGRQRTQASRAWTPPPRQVSHTHVHTHRAQVSKMNTYMHTYTIWDTHAHKHAHTCTYPQAHIHMDTPHTHPYIHTGTRGAVTPPPGPGTPRDLGSGASWGGGTSSHPGTPGRCEQMEQGGGSPECRGAGLGSKGDGAESM